MSGTRFACEMFKITLSRPRKRVRHFVWQRWLEQLENDILFCIKRRYRTNFVRKSIIYLVTLDCCLARFARISLVNRHLISGISWSVCLEHTVDSVFLESIVYFVFSKTYFWFCCSRMLPVDSVFWIVVNITIGFGDPRGSPWFIWLHSWIKLLYWKQMNKCFRLFAIPYERNWQLIF